MSTNAHHAYTVYLSLCVCVCGGATMGKFSPPPSACRLSQVIWLAAVKKRVLDHICVIQQGSAYSPFPRCFLLYRLRLHRTPGSRAAAVSLLNKGLKQRTENYLPFRQVVPKLIWYSGGENNNNRGCDLMDWGGRDAIKVD